MTATKTTTGPAMSDRIAAMKTAVLGDDHAQALRVADEAMAMAMSLPSAPANTHPDPSSGALTPEWVDAEADRIAATERRTVKYKLLISVARDARGHADGIRITRANAQLAGLNDLLADLIAEVRDIAEQMGPNVDTTSAAVTAGHGNHWRRLQELAEDYAALRAEQNLITPADAQMSARPNNAHHDPIASDLIAADLDELWPWWQTPHLDPHQNININGSQPRPEPWPDDETEQILWLAQHGSPWIPTTIQLADLHRERAERRNADARPKPTVFPYGSPKTERPQHV